MRNKKIWHNFQVFNTELFKINKEFLALNGETNIKNII